MKAKLTRRILAALLVVVMLLAIVPAAFASSFADVKDSSWYADAVEYCVSNSIMSGVGDGKFDPNGKVTREQGVQALYALDGSKEVEFENLFSDVTKATKWFAPAVIWGAKNDIVAGIGNGKFGVGQNVTREQMASFFFRYANYAKADTSAADDLAAFPDKGDTSKWAVDAVKWAVGAGIISGKGQKDNSVLLKPKDELTRAELAVMMMKFHQYINAKEDLTGKTVILHTNDVHGSIAGYAYIAGLKADFEAKGARVILADAGDYSQGSTAVSLSKGANAVDMMNLVGYDIATLGNHEFDYGAAQLAENLSKAEFAITCSNVLEEGESIYDPYVIIEKDGVKIAFVGLETPEAQTKANPALIQGLTFLTNDTDPALWGNTKAQVDAAKAAGADLVIALAHLGVDDESAPYTSYDLLKNVEGIDFVIDGHSHTVMEAGENGEAIQSTGTAFANVGCIVIDNETKTIEDNYLIPVDENTPKDETVAAAAQQILDAIAEEYGAKFAESLVDLNGDKAPNGNRDSETNNGDFITDAMIWSVTEQNPGSITGVPAENIVAITNGGGIRAWIHKGDVTKNDIFTVLPFGNTVAVVYVTGAELLEALEASTFSTPTAVGGFPQIAGMNITIDTSKAYDANETTYPGSTYYGPASINRVTINDVNGKPFDPAATYAVVTNNFCAAGGDTYYAFAAASSQFDTGRPLDEVVMDYVTEKLGGVIGLDYAEPQGRITFKTEDDFAGKTVILHSNDVHGSIAGYAYMAGLKADFEAKGARVILADAGDYSQGNTAVSLSKGANAIKMMNLVGYDIATLGNHEFDYGAEQLEKNLEEAEFLTLCCNVLKDGEPLYSPRTAFTFDDAVKGIAAPRIAFIGIETPEAQTKANPALIQGLTFLTNDTEPALWDAIQEQVDEAKEDDARIVIALAHLGVDEGSQPYTSYDLLENVEGIDFVIDGHSHTVMEAGKNGEPIQSTGTAFANVGCIVIDNESKTIEDSYLIPVDENTPKDETVAAAAQEIIDAIAEEYGEVFATSEVDLNGDKAPNGNRDSETNNGDMITDAMIWCVTEQYPGSITEVPAENIVAITNGGGIRAWIHKGDVTKNDIFTVLPFGNTVTVVYVTGAELLEALEASTFCTPASLGGFPQVAGIEFTLDTSKEYDANAETYPGSTYYGPASINRVTIDSVNGQPFDPEAKYAVVTNNFCAGGGDTYYAFAAASSQFDTGYTLDAVVMDYIEDKLGGVISADLYAEPQGRITVLTGDEPWDGKVIIGGTTLNVWFTKYGNTYCDCTEAHFTGTDDNGFGFKEGDIVTVKFLDQEIDLPVGTNYSDVDSGTPMIKVNAGGYIEFAINMGNFGSTYGLVDIVKGADGTYTITPKEGVTFPVEITFELKEAQGYAAELAMHRLVRTNNREDYADLTDEEFANFRQVTTTGMGDHLYRGSSPINPEIGRNGYADAAIEDAGVTVILNLADSQAIAEGYEGFADTYYAGQNVKYLNLGVDFTADDFKAGLADGLKFLAANEGTYYIHCTEGKDRAGFVNALLECLMGATAEEVVADYMVTYYNYYGVTTDDERYEPIAKSNIIKTLQTAFGVEDLATADLAAEAEAYLKEIGMSDEEIAALKANLGDKAEKTFPEYGDLVVVYNPASGTIIGYDEDTDVDESTYEYTYWGYSTEEASVEDKTLKADYYNAGIWYFIDNEDGTFSLLDEYNYDQYKYEYFLYAEMGECYSYYVGEGACFTPEKVDGGYLFKCADGTYLAVVDGVVLPMDYVEGDASFVFQFAEFEDFDEDDNVVCTII